jgi:hypothetical protein
VRSDGALQSALDVARGFATEAEATLAGVDGPAAEALRCMGHHLVGTVPAFA